MFWESPLHPFLPLLFSSFLSLTHSFTHSSLIHGQDTEVLVSALVSEEASSDSNQGWELEQVLGWGWGQKGRRS